MASSVCFFAGFLPHRMRDKAIRDYRDSLLNPQTHVMPAKNRPAERSRGPHRPLRRPRSAPPRHVSRGNRRETVFFSDADYELYRDLLAQQCRKHGVAVWADCLMPNHVHLILVPDRAEALGRALGEAHRRYRAVVNARMRAAGHLFQSRFAPRVTTLLVNL